MLIVNAEDVAKLLNINLKELANPIPSDPSDSGENEPSK